MDQATDHLPGIITIHDDICMFGHTPEEHDEHLLHLMEFAKTHGIVFNSAKCHIRWPQIAFYGAVFTGQSMWQDPSKIQALQDLPASDLQTKLQSFLGLINYLQPFIPGQSAKTSFPSRAALPMGLEPFDRCSIPALKSLDLSDPPQGYSGFIMTGPNQLWYRQMLVSSG